MPAPRSDYKVFVLSGAANAGKTTTLNHLAWLVSMIGATRKLDGPTPIRIIPNTRGDAKYCFRVLVRGKPHVVGISTGGDTAEVILQGFEYFSKQHCDICFIASRTSGASVKKIEEMAKKQHVAPRYFFLINEYDSRRQTRLERTTAEFLCSFVQ